MHSAVKSAPLKSAAKPSRTPSLPCGGQAADRRDRPERATRREGETLRVVVVDDGGGRHREAPVADVLEEGGQGRVGPRAPVVVGEPDVVRAQREGVQHPVGEAAGAPEVASRRQPRGRHGERLDEGSHPVVGAVVDDDDVTGRRLLGREGRERALEQLDPVAGHDDGRRGGGPGEQVLAGGVLGRHQFPAPLGTAVSDSSSLSVRNSALACRVPLDDEPALPVV